MTKIYAASHGWIRTGDKFLVLRRSDTTRYMPGLWDMPGGTVEPGESPEEALIREIAEETQINAEIGLIIYVYNNVSQYPERQTFQMVFECQSGRRDINLNPREHSEYAWLTIGEIRKLSLIGFLSGFLDSGAYSRCQS